MSEIKYQRSYQIPYPYIYNNNNSINTFEIFDSGASDRGPEQERRAVRGLLQLRLRRLDREESDTPEPDILGSAELVARGAAQESQDTARRTGPR